MDINEVRTRLEDALGDDLKGQYFSYFRQLFLFNPTLTKDEFDEKVRGLFKNDEQISCHNDFIFAINLRASTLRDSPPPQPPPPPPAPKSGCCKQPFELPNYPEYVKSRMSNRNIPSNYTYPRAAIELFAPYSGLISCRVNLVAWECGLKGADSEVTKLISHACQTFLKNIITAMITKVKGFKIREGKFQYGFNMPLPDPYLRNSMKVVDENVDMEILDDEKLLPKCSMSLERTQYGRAYAYAASKKIRRTVTLDTKLLYQTIRDNPSLFGQYGIHSVQTLKLSLHGEEDKSFSEDSDE
ncbi:hypothetical protein ABEB36_012160 [Hypothenemus hampei]|uniref:Transcriptional adapter 1 n=1 Tax=Hypothenemus hampei TaxID=57062 RepID=A0ABD1EAI8_HYPHA